ncbi:L,D-transpeptidase catalytic domain [Rhodobacteraceae bacterium THAF1]|nr:L,D-transpeptidase catalytic domain [Palleronia sp. THAF1]VDC17173.1 L,D-transpeptidase catalytic domain [Rhodobacteraceae bacterium THAF1]
MVLTPTGLRFAGRCIPCTIGRGGVTDRKAEGDGATPTGVHRIVGMLYRPDRIARPTDWAVPIHPRDIWSDDPSDPAYNTMAIAPSRFSHESLRRADPLYDLVILTDWNWPMAVPGRGSAIFIHRWRRRGYPTEGCIAMDPRDLLWVAQRIGFETRLIV